MKADASFEVPLYSYHVRLTVFQKWEDVKQEYINETQNGIPNKNSEVGREGWISRNENNPYNIHIYVNIDYCSCGIHELVHLKNWIFYDTGIHSEKDSDEHETYLIQAMYRKYYDAYERAVKVIKSKKKRK